MKLQMKDQLSFQKAMGYEDTPEPMSINEVYGQLEYWGNELADLIDGSLESKYSDAIVQIESFVNELRRGEIEYTEPLKTYGYFAGFEYFKKFKVDAVSQEQADEKALAVFRQMKDGLPKKVGDATFGWNYLEQFEDNFGSRDRIYEG